MNRRTKVILNQLGIRLMFAITINFYIFLVVAMFNSHTVQVIFNHYNEALIEYVIYFSILPVIVYSLIYEIKEHKRNTKERKGHGNRR